MDENFHKDKNQRYDKMFTKYFMGGGDFHVGKLTPIPQGKKKKLNPEKIISQVKCKRNRKDDKKID